MRGRRSRFRTEPAAAWCLESPERPEWKLTGALEIVRGSDPDGLEILVGRRDSGHLLAHIARGGQIMIARYRPFRTWPGPLEVLAEERLPGPLDGQRLGFELRVSPAALELRVGGVQLSVETDAIDRTGDWGLGARAGVAGVWYDVRVD